MAPRRLGATLLVLAFFAALVAVLAASPVPSLRRTQATAASDACKRVDSGTCSKECMAVTKNDTAGCAAGCSIRCESVVFCWSLQQCVGRCNVSFPFQQMKEACWVGCKDACSN